MHLMRHEPWSVFDRLQRQFDNCAAPANGGEMPASWRPAVDISEEDDRYVFHADLPGVAPEDIEVTMEKGRLILRGERRAEETDSRPGYFRNERAVGKFLRRFELPETVDTDSISATTSNGVLTVTIPKKARPEPRRINIEAT